MSESAAGRPEIVALRAEVMPPALSHRVYTLIGFAWPAFGVIFLILLCSTEWFVWPFPIWQIFVPVCLVALALGHLVATLLESKAVTSLFTYFRGGMPLIFYQHFALLQLPVGPSIDTAPAALINGAPAIVFGGKRIRLSAVDELYLTLLGMVEIKSYAAAGRLTSGAAAPSNKADLLARVPLGSLGLADQKKLIETFREYNPALIVNKRLEERLQSPIVKGQAAIAAFGAGILLYALFDVSYATFTWLEMLKDYYGSQLCMRLPEKARAFLPPGAAAAVGSPAAKARAAQLYDQAESLRLHPAALSWAYRALFANGNSAAQLVDIRAETLYRLGRPDEAIGLLRQAVTLKASGFKTQLQLARYLSRAGQGKEASALIDEVLKKHKDVLLPRLYNLALLPTTGGSADSALYRQYLAELDEEVFGEEPAWPPGGEKPLMEMWRREDLEFLAQHLLKVPPAAPAQK